MEIKITDYLSKEEIKEICNNELRIQIREFFQNEKNAQRLLSNLSYQIIFDEVDKIIPSCKKIIEEKVKEIIKNQTSYSVFRGREYGREPSLAYKMLETEVSKNKELLNEKIKDTIINTDYTEKIWNIFEKLGETFMENIYTITELGRSKKQ
jgi:hypothetical protein